MADALDVDLPAVDRQAAVGIGARHEVLRGGFLAAQRGHPGQVGKEADFLVKACVDGVDQALGGSVIDHGVGVAGGCRLS